jgi:hypothetical protein
MADKEKDMQILYVGAMIDMYVVWGIIIVFLLWLDFRRKQHRKKQLAKYASSRFHRYAHYKDKRTLVLIEKNVKRMVGLVYQDSFNTAEEVYVFLFPQMWPSPYFLDMRIYRADGEVLTFVRDQTQTREQNLARLEEMLFERRKIRTQLRDDKNIDDSNQW